MRFTLRLLIKRVFHLLLVRLGVRRLRGHSFFGTLLTAPIVVADFGAHRGEFFAALKNEYPVLRALLVEADPALAESLKARFGDRAIVVHSALVGTNQKKIMFTRSVNPESSSIFSERAAVHGVTDHLEVSTVDLSEAVQRLGYVDLAKFDVEGAEMEVLRNARRLELAACGQLTVEFHDNSASVIGHDIHRLYQRMRCDGFAVVNANWPYFDDVLFVNLKRMPAARRLLFRCRMALVNALLILRGGFFWGIRLMKI